MDIGFLIFWLFLLSPLALIGALFIARSRRSLLIIEILLCCLSAWTLYYAAGIAWVFRDGMAVGMFVSTGRQAWINFVDGFWFLLALILSILTARIICYRIQLGRIRRNSV